MRMLHKLSRGLYKTVQCKELPNGLLLLRKMLRFASSFAVLCLICTGVQVRPHQTLEREVKEEVVPDKEELLQNQQKLSDLPPQQAKKSIQELVQRIDTDGNSGLSVEEMVEWMVRLERDQQTQGLRDHFREADRNSNGFVTLTEFAHTMGNADEQIKADMDEILAYSRPVFNGADADGDGQLTLQEYTAFMHPELHLHMIDVLVDTFLEQFDNNDDGYVSFYEYMVLYMPASPEERDKQSDWAEDVRKIFNEELDLNKDGLLDKVEMRGWVASDVTQQAHNEAKELLQRIDKDKNGEVSHTEALGEMQIIAESKLAHHHISHNEL